MAKRWRFLLTGVSEAGKSSLCAALFNSGNPVRKTQDPEYHAGAVVDLPGEYLTHPHLRTAFLANAEDVDAILYLQPANAGVYHVPPGLLQTVPNLKLIGVVSKVDLPDANIAVARGELCRAGITEPVFEVSIHRPETVHKLRLFLEEQGLFPAEGE